MKKTKSATCHATRRATVCVGCEHLQMEAQFGFTEKMACGYDHPFPESLRPAEKLDYGHPSVEEYETDRPCSRCPRLEAHETLCRLREL